MLSTLTRALADDAATAALGGSLARLLVPGLSIHLSGPLGAGKTTLGRELARRLGRAFIDLDDAAVARAGQPIAALVAAHGWQKAQRLA